MKKTMFLLLLSIAAIGCNNDDDASSAPKNTVQLANNATHGKILTDSKGKSLYFFSLDTKETSVCMEAGDCLKNWPIFYDANPVIGTGLTAADFKTITRTDGKKQTTYKGWPLYYFVNDASAGDTKGDKVGDVWFIAKPDYSLMYVKAQLQGLNADGKLTNYKDDYTEGDALTSYITDIEGRTLYTFINDKKDINNFTAEDLSNNAVWPIYYNDLMKIPSILDAKDFGTITVHEKKQLTYKGWPLYYYGADKKRGDNLGISFPKPGIWPIANTSLKDAPSAK